jgi:hypothetical protein
MDAPKKAALEKRMIIGLLCLFGVTFTGALRHLGVFGHASARTQASRPAEQVRIKNTLVETIQEHRMRMTPREPDTAPAVAPTASVRAPAYTAGELRDPMKSLLPHPQREIQRGSASKAEEPTPAKPLPPSLSVNGILWGGPKPQAIINNEVYGVGDAVGGVTILSIDQGGVTVEYQGGPVFYPTSTQMTPSGRARTPQAHWR